MATQPCTCIITHSFYNPCPFFSFFKSFRSRINNILFWETLGCVIECDDESDFDDGNGRSTNYIASTSNAKFAESSHHSSDAHSKRLHDHNDDEHGTPATNGGLAWARTRKKFVFVIINAYSTRYIRRGFTQSFFFFTDRSKSFNSPFKIRLTFNPCITLKDN